MYDRASTMCVAFRVFIFINELVFIELIVANVISDKRELNEKNEMEALLLRHCTYYQTY